MEKEKKELKKILVFPGGSEIGLEINRALYNCKNILLYSANSRVSNHSSYVYKNNNIISDVNCSLWIRELNKLIKQKQIDYIYPAHDKVLIALSENREKIKAEIILPSKEVCKITRSKKETYNKFKNIIPVPKMIEDFSDIKWPIFLKPNKGQGSENTFLVKNIEEVNFYLNKYSDMLAMEYLPGKEYTIDCFSDKNKKLLFCGGRERVRIRNGISVSSQIVKNDIFINFAKKIINNLDIFGAWFFQLKETADRKLKLLEIAPRISGTMSLYRTLGVNFPLLSIYQRANTKIEIMTNNFDVKVDRALISRYKHNLKYKNIYIDFDDTFVVDGKVNSGLMKFIYQSKNQDKRIILITKSESDICKQLEKYCISKNIFSEIIQIDKSDSKTKYINKKFSIFIDDSFSERREVAKNKIPTFDLSMLDLLFDDRN
jgi:carbamoyl-phosphate synthase large subunit